MAQPPPTAIEDAAKVKADIDQLVRSVEELRKSYEQYFLGLEKREPALKRRKVADLVKAYTGVVIKNTAVKFKHQQCVARYNTLVLYWDRILREMEEGKYERDVFRSKLHEAERGIKAPATTDPMSTLFDEYLKAKKGVNESIKGLTLDAFRKGLQAQVQAIKEKTKAADVKFQVVTEAGKVKIKAIPTKR